jgi:hypothetical protein
MLGRTGLILEPEIRLRRGLAELLVLVRFLVLIQQGVARDRMLLRRVLRRLRRHRVPRLRLLLRRMLRFRKMVARVIRKRRKLRRLRRLLSLRLRSRRLLNLLRELERASLLLGLLR